MKARRHEDNEKKRRNACFNRRPASARPLNVSLSRGCRDALRFAARCATRCAARCTTVAARSAICVQGLSGDVPMKIVDVNALLSQCSCPRRSPHERPAQLLAGGLGRTAPRQAAAGELYREAGSSGQAQRATGWGDCMLSEFLNHLLLG